MVQLLEQSETNTLQDTQVQCYIYYMKVEMSNLTFSFAKVDLLGLHPVR